jgi:hypothetical protein
LVSSTSTTKRAAEAATIFSLVCAPPPPFMRSSDGATSSAPSTARSSRGTSPRVRTTGRPRARSPPPPARHHAGQLERLLARPPGELLDEAARGVARAEPDHHAVLDQRGALAGDPIARGLDPGSAVGLIPRSTIRPPGSSR